MFLGLGTAALLSIVAIIPERGGGDRMGRSGGFVSARSCCPHGAIRADGRVEEVLEVAEILSTGADRLGAVLERSETPTKETPTDDTPAPGEPLPPTVPPTDQPLRPQG